MMKTFKGLADFLIQLIPDGKIKTFGDFLKMCVAVPLVGACFIPWGFTVVWFGYIAGDSANIFIGVGMGLLVLYSMFFWYSKEIKINWGN